MTSLPSALWVTHRSADQAMRTHIVLCGVSASVNFDFACVIEGVACKLTHVTVLRYSTALVKGLPPLLLKLDVLALSRKSCCP